MGLIKRLPFALSGRSTAASASFALSGVPYDVAIGGMPFLTAMAYEPARPYTRSGAPMRKDQFDNQQVPGEQSLASWWLRSQSTFIGGEGLLYQDPSNDNQYAIRYGQSVGVNPWTNGELSLLRRTTERIDDASANTGHMVGWSDGTDRFWYAVGNVLRSDTGSATTTITWGGANTIRSLASDGTRYYAADDVNVYRGTGNGAGAALCATGTTNVVLGWVKGRLMLGEDNLIYEVDDAGTKTLKFTHLNPSFRWTAFAEGTNAIYAAGNAGAQGDVYKLVLESNGAVPTLASGGVLTAQLPRGEIVHALCSYLGTFVGVGTNRGFRVGQIDEGGDILYGPLLIENASGVKAIGAYDRFFFVAATDAIDGNSGLYRVDLGQPLQGGDIAPAVRFAFAADLQAHVTGEVTGVTNFGTSDRMALCVTGQGAFLEHASEREATGWLKTGRVRYNTLEPKIFKFVTVRTPATLAGSVSVSVIDPGGATTSILTTTEGSGIQIENVILPAPGRAVEWVQLQLTLTRSSVDTATGGEVHGWQLKAMPGATRQRLFTLPLQCWDKEKAKNGGMVGREGRTIARLEAFEQLFAAGDSVSFQDLKNGLSYQVVIDDYRFEQRAQPGSNKSVFGGILWVELRTIADVVS